MNPWYALMETQLRWWYLAGILLLAAAVGAMAMLAYGWPHGLARAWFWVLFVGMLGCAVKGVLEWLHPPAPADLRASGRPQDPTRPGSRPSDS